MARSNYSHEFAGGLTVRGIPIIQAHPGKVFWVGNAAAAALEGQRAASNGNVGTFDAPFSTLDYAIGKCTAGRGDIIFVKPGHAENISAAAGIAADIAGVAIIGLGTGAARPTFSWTAAAATLAITAANITLHNLRFVANFADVTTMFDVSGAGDGLSFENCLFTDTSTILNFVDCITLATGADDLSFINCRGIGKSASNDSFLTGVAHDRFYMADCQWQLDVAQTAVVGLFETSGNATNVWIKDSVFCSIVDGALFLDFNGANNTGVIANCYFSSLDIAGAVTAGFDFTGGHMFECYVAGEADTYGIIGGGTAYNNA